MPFPSIYGTKQENLSSAWTSARSIAGNIKTRALNISAQSQAGTLQAASILDFVAYLADAKAELTRISGLQGISTYAQEQLADPTLNIATEYNALIAALDNTVSWVIANFPKSVEGYLLVQTFAVENNGRTISRTFTTEETATLRTVLDSLIVAID